MAKENTAGSEQKQTSGTLPSPTPATTTKSKASTRSANKNNRAQIGGTAVPGAKSTLPKQISNTNNPQAQERESSNRTMRRRMEQLGTGQQAAPTKAPRNRRKERLERIKERQQAQVASVKRSLPGGKVSTDTSRVYYLIGGVAAAIVLLIVLFVILRTTGVLH
jgi:hypothetical protein